ncbi:MAG: phosphate acyltransferase PlsX [Bacillota bacterium]
MTQAFEKRPSIGVDLMGGDFAPSAAIEGCLIALSRGVKVTAFGDEEATSALRQKAGSAELEVRVCTERVTFEDAPVASLRDKPDSSIRRGIEAVKAGETSAFVSAGSTGALVAGGVLLLGRAKGVDKPCLAMVLPTKTGRGVLVLDLGASADARPETLVQFAIMGDVYAKGVLGWETPAVGLLNIGTEPEKGSLMARKAHSLLSGAPLRFVGNIEARDVFDGVADVVVTDGFTGNVFLKTCEGTASFQMDTLRASLTQGFFRSAAALMLKPAFREVKALLDYSSYGGAPLLGLSGCVVKCHGPSGPKAIANGIEQARRFVEKDVSGVISTTLCAMPAKGE